MPSFQPCIQLLFWCLLGFSSSLLAQQPTDSIPISIVKNTDGNQFIGKITSQDSAFITLATENLGVMKLPKKFIKTIKPLKSSQIVGGEYWAENPHTTRYFLASNGYGLKKGEGHYQNTWVLGNELSFGLTDHLSLGVGLVPLFLFSGRGAPTSIWVTPKASIPIKKDKLNIGLGAFIGGQFGGRQLDGGGQKDPEFGLVYSNVTVGPRERNASFGLGFGYIDGEWSNAPVINMSFMSRIGKKTVFISENYMFGRGDGAASILSGGLRFLAEKVVVDASFFVISGDEDGFPGALIPWLSIHVPFNMNGKNKK